MIGIEFILQTDHKPLISIFGENKGIPLMAAARMQRWAFILSGFNFKIRHVKGTENYADSLSRIPQLKIESNCSADSMNVNFIDNESANYINLIDANNALQLSFKSIANETRRDKILSKVMHAVQNGTLAELKGDEFTPFQAKKHELSVESGCLLWGYRSIVPTKLRKQILFDLHKSNLGIVKTKALARSYIWWPKLDSEIENVVKSCKSCQIYQASPEKSALIPWQPADHPWSRIHIDFAGPIRGFHLLVIVDSFSKWIEVFKTTSITSNFTINKLRETFCRYGLVDTLVSDNGRQFTSSEFSQFMKNNHIKHILTAPGHPATNGQAENFVKTLKKSILANLNDNNSDNFDLILNRFVFDYRITKHMSTGDSPAEIMLGRPLKSRFSLLRPPLVRDKIISSQETNVKNFHGRREVQFEKGRKVNIRDYTNPNKPSWVPATIKENRGHRHYDCVITHNGRKIKRHLNQIREATSLNESLNVTELNANDFRPENQSTPEQSNIRQSNARYTDSSQGQPDGGSDSTLVNENTSNSEDNTIHSEYSPTLNSDVSSMNTQIDRFASPPSTRPTRGSALAAKEKITDQYHNALV